MEWTNEIHLSEGFQQALELLPIRSSRYREVVAEIEEDEVVAEDEAQEEPDEVVVEISIEEANLQFIISSS